MKNETCEMLTDVLYQIIIEIVNYFAEKEIFKVFRHLIVIPAAFYFIKVRKSLVDYPGNVC